MRRVHVGQAGGRVVARRDSRAIGRGRYRRPAVLRSVPGAQPHGPRLASVGGVLGAGADRWRAAGRRHRLLHPGAGDPGDLWALRDHGRLRSVLAGDAAVLARVYGRACRLSKLGAGSTDQPGGNYAQPIPRVDRRADSSRRAGLGASGPARCGGGAGVPRCRAFTRQERDLRGDVGGGDDCGGVQPGRSAGGSAGRDGPDSGQRQAARRPGEHAGLERGIRRLAGRVGAG